MGAASEFCNEAKDSFRKNLEDDVYEQYPENGFYIYQIEHGLHKHIGLVGLNDVHDFLNGRVKKHEDTLSERELHQKELFLQWVAILKPILLTHRPVPELSSWLNRYVQLHIPMMVIRLSKEEATHRFWAVSTEEDIKYLQSLFASQITETYIADGHHRATTTAMLYADPEMRAKGLDMSQLFCAWFSADQLDILDYNRVVEGVKKIGSARLMAQLAQIFEIRILEKARKPQQKHEIVMCLDKGWYALRWRDFVLEQSSEGFDTLDTALLNELVINKIFGIADVRTDTRISYVDGSKGMEGLKKSIRQNRNNRVGFAFYPVTFADLTRMADAGENLPPKSTYFEPRLKSGLLVRMLKEN